MRLYYKLLLGYLALAGLTGLLGFIAVQINREAQRDAASLVESVIPEADSAEEMFDTLVRIKTAAREILINKFAPQISQGSTNEEAERLLFTEISKLEECIKNGRKATEAGIRINTEADEKEEIETDEDELKTLDQMEKELGVYKGYCVEFAKLTDATHSMEMLRETLTPQTKRLEEIIQKYRVSHEEELVSETSAIAAYLKHTNLVLLISTLAAFGAAIVLGWVVSRSILKPVKLLTEGSNRLAKGQWDAPIDYRSRDEFGVLTNSFNQMAKDLKSTTVSKDYVDGILSSMADTLVVLRPDRTIQSVNHATVDLLGYTEAELAGRSFNDIIKSEFQSETLLSTILEKNSVRALEVCYRARSGETIPMSFSASVLRNEAGAINGIVCVAQDMRARKEAEAKLEATHRDLVEASRRAGMAEMATGVLHNVGNVLNSVNIATAVVVESMRKSKAANLSKVVGIIQEHPTDLGEFLANDPKGRKIIPYLGELSQHLASEQTKILDELDDLMQNVEHIKEIVAVQQNYAKATGITETVKVTDLIEDSLRLNSGALTRHGITLVREFETEPIITVEKHKVLQILINLIRNAKYACEESTNADKRLTIRVNNGGGNVKISVIDNGIGIPSENLIRIFNHGFTTRTGGHGFGLHSGAIAAKEMGGSLNVFSEGLGKGAAFTLQLPCRPTPKVHSDN